MNHFQPPSRYIPDKVAKTFMNRLSPPMCSHRDRQNPECSPRRPHLAPVQPDIFCKLLLAFWGSGGIVPEGNDLGGLESIVPHDRRVLCVFLSCVAGLAHLIGAFCHVSAAHYIFQPPSASTVGRGLTVVLPMCGGSRADVVDLGASLNSSPPSLFVASPFRDV